MAYVVELDLDTSPRELERLALPEAPVAAQPHWLLESWYGRDLLKVALRKLHPELAVSMYRHAPEADDHLEMVVDELALRDWAQPKSTWERARRVFAIAKMYPAISRGEREVRHLVG